MTTPDPTPNLTPHTLYLMLTLRSGQPNDYHWALYFHHNNASGGIRYHITGSAGRWTPAHQSQGGTGIMKTFLLVGLLQLAELDDEVRDALLTIARQDDDRLNEIEGLTCRTWVGRVCDRLSETGLVRLPDWETLQAEAFAFGNEHLQSAVDNVQPRPVMRSTLFHEQETSS